VKLAFKHSLLAAPRWVIPLATFALLSIGTAVTAWAPLPVGVFIAASSAITVRYILLRKHQEDAIARSEQQMRLLIEHTPAAVAMFDREMRYIMTSRRWLEDYGLVGQQIIGRCHYEIFPEIRRMPRWLSIHQRALSGESFARREDSWLRANGQPEWNEWAIHPWIDADGRVGGIVMFTEVITARKIAEAALRSSEEENRAAMEHAPIGKALVYPNGRFAKVNPALCRLLGYSPEELLANDIQSISHPDDLPRDLDLLGKVILGVIPSYDMEKRYFHRDGRVIVAQLSVAGVRRRTGETDFLVVQVQDISERKAIEHMKNEFISIVSHELRTPLTSIRGSLGLMTGLKDEPLSPKVRRLADIAHDNCERLVLLVNDILDLDKITSGHMRLDLQEESVRNVTDRAIAGVEAFAQKHEVTIRLCADIDDAKIMVDADRFIQVMTNLLSNAAKFSPKGSEIVVALTEQWGCVRVSVQDRGPGIAEEFRERIFGRFAQADSSATRHKGGTGLGLHITQKLVEQMRGKIGFATEMGKGTTFWVEFPVNEAAVEDAPAFGT
jgi:PAS domain S-box-containing protein